MDPDAVPGVERELRVRGGGGVRPQPGLRRLLLPRGVGLLLEGRAEGSAVGGAVLHWLLLPPVDHEAHLGPPHRRRFRPWLSPPPLLRRCR